MRHGAGLWSPTQIPKRVSPEVRTRRKRREEEKEMYDDFYAAQDRTLREQEFADKVAERQRYARPTDRLSLRARLARRLFLLAVAAEREETWRVVWERLEAKRP